MKRRFAVPALAVALLTCLTAAPAGASPDASAAKQKGKGKQPKNKVFLACQHGCKYRTIQQRGGRGRRIQSTSRRTARSGDVKVKPGKYVEGVVLDGRLKRRRNSTG